MGENVGDWECCVWVLSRERWYAEREERSLHAGKTNTKVLPQRVRLKETESVLASAGCALILAVLLSTLQGSMKSFGIS